MRFLHIATLVTPDGAYGGPIRVAANQVKALRQRGHDAVLVAGAAGFRTLPDSWDGVPVVLFRARRAIPGFGFAGTVAPRLRRWVRRNAKRFDVAHVHLARDLVTLPAALAWMRSGRPFVTQTHGMVLPSARLLAGPFDALGTRRVLRGADVAFHLTEDERAALLEVARGQTSPRRLENGIHVPSPETHLPRCAEVLFLARLHSDKRPLAFVVAAAELAHEFPDTRFTLVGPDGGEGGRVTEAIHNLPHDVRDRVTWEGGVAPESVPGRLARASVYVLPSRRESFGMSVLEAMSVSTPVVVTTGCGIASSIGAAGAGVVIRGPEELAAAVRLLLRDDVARAEMGSQGARLARQRFSMEAVVDELERAYARPLGSSPRQVGAQVGGIFTLRRGPTGWWHQK